MHVPLPPSADNDLPPRKSALVPNLVVGLSDKVIRPTYRAVWRALMQWLDADGLRMSAAMSFYGILSLAPLLVLLVGVLGLWLDQASIELRVIDQIRSVVGAQAAQLLQQAISSAKEPAEGITASVLAFGLLLSGATGVFAELQDALERLWRVGDTNAVKEKWWRGASLRLRGIAYILAFGFLLLISLSVSAFLALVSSWAGNYLPFKLIGFALNELVSFLFCTGLFVALMRMSSGAKPQLRYLVMGAAVGAVLFAVGKQLIAFYLSTAAVVSAYGAAGSLVVLLMWIYFSSAVLLLAASVAKALSDEMAAKPLKAAGPTAAKAVDDAALKTPAPAGTAY